VETASIFIRKAPRPAELIAGAAAWLATFGGPAAFAVVRAVTTKSPDDLVFAALLALLLLRFGILVARSMVAVRFLMTVGLAIVPSLLMYLLLQRVLGQPWTLPSSWIFWGIGVALLLHAGFTKPPALIPRELVPGERPDISLASALPAVRGKKISILREANVAADIAERMRKAFVSAEAEVTLGKSNDDDVSVWLRITDGHLTFHLSSRHLPTTAAIRCIDWPSQIRGPRHTYNKTRIATDAALQGAYHTAIFATTLQAPPYSPTLMN
jgi:hypothetical protein